MAWPFPLRPLLYCDMLPCNGYCKVCEEYESTNKKKNIQDIVTHYTVLHTSFLSAVSMRRNNCTWGQELWPCGWNLYAVVMTVSNCLWGHGVCPCWGFLLAVFMSWNNCGRYNFSRGHKLWACSCNFPCCCYLSVAKIRHLRCTQQELYHGVIRSAGGSF